MPANHHRAADQLAKLGMLTRVGSLDPADPETLRQITAALENWMRSYIAAGDTRPLRVFISHEPQTKTEKED
jgi:hypothetical protein